jgi:hypothetical protein
MLDAYLKTRSEKEIASPYFLPSARHLEQRVNEWGKSGLSPEEKKESHADENHDHGNHPPKFLIPEKIDELTKDTKPISQLLD